MAAPAECHGAYVHLVQLGWRARNRSGRAVEQHVRLSSGRGRSHRLGRGPALRLLSPSMIVSCCSTSAFPPVGVGRMARPAQRHPLIQRGGTSNQGGSCRTRRSASCERSAPGAASIDHPRDVLRSRQRRTGISASVALGARLVPGAGRRLEDVAVLGELVCICPRRADERSSSGGARLGDSRLFPVRADVVEPAVFLLGRPVPPSGCPTRSRGRWDALAALKDAHAHCLNWQDASSIKRGTGRRCRAGCLEAPGTQLCVRSGDQISRRAASCRRSRCRT